MYDTIGIWVGAFFTLAIYSFLYKENPIYRLAEHLVVGISSGYAMAVTYQITVKPRLIDRSPFLPIAETTTTAFRYDASSLMQ